MNETPAKPSQDQRLALDRPGCRAGTDHDRGVAEIDLLSPLTIRGVTFRNRIAMSPMCQYSARRGPGQRLAPRASRQPGRGRGRRWSWSRPRPSPATAASLPATWGFGATSTSSLSPASPVSSSARARWPASSSPMRDARRAATCRGRAGRLKTSRGRLAGGGPSPIPFKPSDPVPDPAR